MSFLTQSHQIFFGCPLSNSLWIHFLQPWHKIELLPTPFLHTPQGHLPFSSTLSFILQLNITFVFPVFILKHFASNHDFHFTILSRRLSSLSAIKYKSSAYSNSRGKPARSSLEIISITITNSKGLSTDPWSNPTFTLNALLSPSVVLTTVCAPSYIAMTAFTNHSSTPSFLRAHLVTSLGTLSNAFSKSTKAK